MSTDPAGRRAPGAGERAPSTGKQAANERNHT